MNEQVARKVVLTRAIETEDAEKQVLSDDDRVYATRSARELAQWQAADSKSPVTQDHFLEQRSELILKRLGERMPTFGAFLQRRPGLPTLSLAFPLLALIAGAGLDRIADPHRVDLLSAPLLFIIGWNLLVYLGLLVWALLPSKKPGATGSALLRRLAVGKAALPRKLPATLAAALTRFLEEWAKLSYGLNRARITWIMHLSAASFALGAILSLYGRGMLTEYVVGWESTFLDATQVHALLSALFTPALLVLPLQGFSLADIEALRFSATPRGTGGGARWVHLYAATLALLVIVPRLVLAAVAGWRARRLSRNFPLDLAQPYFRKLGENLGAGAGGVLRVFPYSFTVDQGRDVGLAAVAALTLGERARLMLRPSAPYGEDPQESLREAQLDDATVTVSAALFNLAATPEKENHGAFLDYLARHNPGGIAVLIDESGLVERAGAQAGADARLAERMALWRQFCSFHHTEATFVNLLQPQKYPLDLDAGLVVSSAR
ncbi:MAG TPA: DUF2868 domain-containing protein [Telluria sp.]